MANQTINKELPLRKWGKKMITDWKQIIEGFQIEIDEKVYEVITNEMIVKTSKTGKVYRKRMLTVKEVETNKVEQVSSDSFKDLTFAKRFKDKVKKVAKTTSKRSRAKVKEIPVIEETKPETKPVDIPLDKTKPDSELKTCDYEQYIFKVQRETGVYSEEDDNFPEFMQTMFDSMDDNLDLDSLGDDLDLDLLEDDIAY